MKVNFLPINFQYSTNQTRQKRGVVSYSLNPLACDTVTFGSMKKKEFGGIDFAVVEKFKAPIEKFNSNSDLQNWARKKAETIANKDFGGRQEETQIQRKAMLKEWSDYVFYENKNFSDTTSLLILDAVTKNMKSDNDKLLPVLNKKVLDECINEIEKNTKADSKFQFNLNKIYTTKLREFYLQNSQESIDEGKWIVIPSKEHDFANFDKNVKQLKSLSYKNWSTHSFQAESYLKSRDFHIYLENGQPKICLKLIGNKVEEIQGKNNDGKIPIIYLDKVEEYINQNQFDLSKDTREELIEADKIKQKMAKIKEYLKPEIENNDVKSIFKYFNIDVKEDDEGFLILSKYEQPSSDFTFANLGIDENKLLENVKYINGNADLRNSQVNSLPNLMLVKGALNIANSKIVSMANLTYVGLFANFADSKIKEVPKLKSVGHDIILIDSQVKSIPNLEVIGRDADFDEVKIEDLPKLKKIGRNANFGKSKIKSLPKLESIGCSADFAETSIENLPSLLFVGEDADFYKSHIKSLPSLISIGGDADFSESALKSFPLLRYVGGDLILRDSLLQADDFAKVKVRGEITK